MTAKETAQRVWEIMDAWNEDLRSYDPDVEALLKVTDALHEWSGEAEPPEQS